MKWCSLEEALTWPDGTAYVSRLNVEGVIRWGKLVKFIGNGELCRSPNTQFLRLDDDAPPSDAEATLAAIIRKAGEALVEGAANGQWSIWPTHWAGGCDSVKADGHNTVWVDSVGGEVCRMKTNRGKVDDKVYSNANQICKAVNTLREIAGMGKK